MRGTPHPGDGHSEADGLPGKVGDVHVSSAVDLRTNERQINKGGEEEPHREVRSDRDSRSRRG